MASKTSVVGKRAIPMVAIIGIILVVVAVAIIGIWFATQHSSVTVSGSATSQQSSLGNPSSQATNVYLNESQFVSLLGPGGIYNSTGNTNPETLAQQIMSSTNSSSQGYLANNVSAAWVSVYSINTTTSKIYAEEIVFQSSVAKNVYTAAQKSATSHGNYTALINSSADGMTYFYITTNTYGVGSSALMGYKDNYVAMYLGLGGNANYSDIGSEIASKLP